MKSKVFGLVTALGIGFLAAYPAAAATWYVAPSGSSSGNGSQASPWDFPSVMRGLQPVAPGDTVYLMDGNYAGDGQGPSSMHGKQMVYLRGNSSPGGRITVCPAPGAHPRINPGLAVGEVEDYGSGNVYTYCSYVDFRDLEIASPPWLDANGDANNIHSADTLSWPTDLPNPYGGACFYAGQYCRLINCVIHGAYEGIESWAEDTGFYAYGNIVYACGWIAPDRCHGHCVYTQNNDPNGKFFRQNIFSTPYGNGQQTVQAYGSGDAFANYYWVEDNICMDNGPLIVGGAAISTGNTLNNNVLYTVLLSAGYYAAPSNGVYTVTNNYIVNGDLDFYKIQTLTESNNFVTGGTIRRYTPSESDTPGSPTPTVPKIFLKQQTEFNPSRANLVVFNWGNTSSVLVNFSSMVPPNSPVRLMDPKRFYGTPLWVGNTDGAGSVNVPTPTLFNVFVVLTNGGANLAPVVSAGANQSVRLPTTQVSLAGTVSDDGLPVGAAVTSTWTVTSGPGAVTFGNAAAPATTATFSTLGTYVLRLTATDTSLTAFAEVQVTVSPQPVNQAPVANAGGDKSISLPNTSVSLSGTVSDDGLPVGAAVTATWSVTSGPGTVTFANANSPATTATFSTLGTYVLRLTASDTALTSYGQCTVVVQVSHAERILIDVGDPSTGSGTGWNNFTVLPHWWASPGTLGDGSDNYLQELAAGAMVDSTGALLPGVAFGVANLDDVRTNSGTTKVYTEDGLTYPLTATEDIAQTVDATQGDINGPTTGAEGKIIISGLSGSAYNVRLLSSRDNGGTRLGYFRINGGAIQSVDSGNAPAILTFPNCVPATITCGSTNLSNAIEVEFWGAVGGTVDLNLIDMAAVVTVPPNTPPTVTASAVYPKVMIPNGLALNGTVSDDGLPNPPAACTAAWSVVSGPGAVTFANATAVSTMATFSSAGTYVLQLTANDSLLSGSGNVTVTVLAPGDFNGDGRVDGVDFLIWQSHYPTTSGGTCDHGDANGDGKVDGVDFLVWQSHYHG